MRQSSGSFSEIQLNAKGLHPPKRRSALAERSLSDNNIAPASPDASSYTAPSRTPSYTVSASQGSIAYNGTVAHNTVAKSPAKGKGPQGTPEWRRRLVKGELGYGDQTDLFGNTGLQNIFQKPAEGTSENTPQPKRKLGLLNGLAVLPSSPPPWPPTQQEQEESKQHNGKTEDDIDEQHQQDTLYEDSVEEQEDGSIIRGPSAATQGAPRTVSGQIEFENENFSPVYLTTNLKISQPSLPTPNFRGSELANRLRQIGSPPPSQYQSIAEESAISHSQEDSSLARLQDESLPEDLPAGTPDVPDVGRFVELRRGGYSRDGSFRRRPLSPSPEKAQSSESGTIARPSKSNAIRPVDSHTSPAEEGSNPKTPRRHGNQFLSPERAKNSGSPLKLFDAHDTFTSNRLQRRLSQLEYKSEKTATSSDQGAPTDTTKLVQKASTLTSVEEVSIHRGNSPIPMGDKRAHRRVSAFGEGELNEYQFSGDFSESILEGSVADDSAPDGSPSIDVAPPGSRQPFKFHVESSPVSRNSSQCRRQFSAQSGSVSRSFARPKFQRHRSVSTTRTEEHSEVHQEYTEGKRGPTSPFKNPTPKRRRTIPSVDNDEVTSEGDMLCDGAIKIVHESHIAMQSVIGRKRKDARHDSNNNVADPETLSRRHILRPRNPTPSQRRRDELHAEIMEATEAFIQSSPKLNTIREQLSPPATSESRSEESRAAAIASEVAAFSMKKQMGMRDESRKRSVTTQDFLDEAVKIMNFIRTKGRPSSGLGSLEETEAESELIENAETHPSSSLTFERPPSREGRMSAWKEPNKQPVDPNVMSHLRKYQEKDSDTFLNSSINSLRFSRVRGAVTPEDESVVVEQDDIRITDNPNRHAKSNNPEDKISSQPRTARTQQSTGSSIGHTVVTSASRRSDHVATLAPEAIAHLIPQEIAGMSFDREKNIWVRQKSPSKEHRHHEEERSTLLDSEDDPFGNIPDLTVDDAKEDEVRTGSPVRPQPTAETILEDTEKAEPEDDGRPVTREGKGTAFTDTSSVPSKMSNFAWSYPKTETRATSWSTQAPRNWSTQKAPQVQTTYAIPESDEEDIEHEIKYFEGRGHTHSITHNHRIRDITISIAEQGVRAPKQPPTSPQKNEAAQWLQSDQREAHATQSGRAHIGPSKTLPRAQPHRKPTFTGDGDLSLLEELPANRYRMQLSMSVSAPVLGQGDHNALLAPSSPAKGDVTFMLSDLPEFTLDQIDECELPDRVVVKHDGSRFSKALEDRYAQGTADLVKALQDVEPDEPYWEDLRKVDLHEKGLSTLHRLDELCYQLEELDVSNNGISQVKGIPYSMRRLQAQKNCLTGLTSWTNLLNLQHLDISNNEVDSLDGLAELVHLRVLAVNNNKIKSLDGILHLDGLMELSAGGNQIEMADFAQSNL
tara:strand:+ start:5951 stop:10177 length:4227 start_codon:yes stop_codon:yes gene_type:complete